MEREFDEDKVLEPYLETFEAVHGPRRDPTKRQAGRRARRGLHA